jgi:hypothetical protein
MGIPQNKSVIRGKFLAPEKAVTKHHVSPHIHHNFTTKTPRSSTQFPQNPQQNTTIARPKKILGNPSGRLDRSRRWLVDLKNLIGRNIIQLLHNAAGPLNLN